MTAKEFLERYDNNTLKLDEDDVYKLIRGDFFDNDDCEEVGRVEGYRGRWTQDIDVIFQIEDRFFKINYQKALTELQENYYDTEIVEVERKTKMVEQVYWVEK